MRFLKGIKISAKMLVLGGVGIVVASAATILYAYSSVSREVPEITKASDYRPRTVSQIISVENGQSKVMAEFYVEKRYLTPYDQIPQKVIQAFLSAEDSTFFEHQGINFVAIARAAVANFLAGQVVQGGSTITQQIAKSLYLSPDRNIVRKIKELFLAFQLEKYLSKEDILYLYLNQIYLGSGAYGVQAAARTYFHKDIKKVTIAEMALIAGLPTAPGKYSPLLNPKKAKDRQLYVLKRMLENKFISEDEYRRATAEKTRIYVNDGTEEHLAPHFVEHIRRYLAQKYGDKAVNEDGLTVIVPAAVKYYEAAQAALENGLEDVDQKKGFRGAETTVAQKDWETTKDQLKKEVTKEYFPYRYLTTDGNLDLEEAIKDYDPTFEKSLSGKKLRALITEIHPDKKMAMASIGVTNVMIPWDLASWAKPAEDPKNPKAVRKDPKGIEDVLKPGDMVWVKLVSFTGKEGVKAKLIQIPEVQGALYSVDTVTGQILAMVGGYDFKLSQFNRAVQAKRQMGSTVKPIIYSAALERGYTPATIIVDSPIVFEDAENGVWKPENYEEKFYGDTTMRAALINSRNIPTIKIVQDIKVQTVINQARRFGLDSTFNQDLSISLGSATTSVQDLVHAFTTFPLQGKPFRAVLFEKIIDRDGRILETSKDLPSDRAELNEKIDIEKAPYAPVVPGLRLDPRVAYVMTHLMKEVVQYGTAGKANAVGRPVAGKTGTTQDFHDGWFIGFSPRVVTGVWVGYDDSRTLGHGEVGGNTALPIWVDYMKEALKDFPADDFPVPEGISFVNIDSKTGKRSEGARAIKEAFITGTEPGAAPQMKTTANPNAPTKIEEMDEETLREDN
ncbi:MAG: PBP1A family penicillin-binding protein [Bdellovibrionales bacterium]|nr:PBP1A family penicillin-binding protein [Bdellovibrionales bacterium]